MRCTFRVSKLSFDPFTPRPCSFPQVQLWNHLLHEREGLWRSCPAVYQRQQAVTGAGARGGGGQRPSAKQHVPLGSRAERQECMARKLFIMFVLPFRHFYSSGCYHQLSVLVNSGFKQLCNCIKLVKGSTATEPQDNTYAPISVRILLWLLIIRLQWLQRILSWRPRVPRFPSWVFLLLLQDLRDRRGALLHLNSENAM